MRLTLIALLGGLLLFSCPGGVRPCSTATCPVGCCDAAGLCQSGMSSSACGIGGARCSACTVTQNCTQGMCSSGNSGTGGFGAGGGSSGVGGGFSTGGGTGGASLEVMPAQATVATQSSVTLSGRVVGAVDNGVTFSVVQGSGFISSSSPSSAVYRAQSADATVRILAVATMNSSVSRFIDLSVRDTVTPFGVVPQSISQTPYVLAPASRQTFAGYRIVSAGVSPSAVLAGVRSLEWRVWPSGIIDTGGTLTADALNRRVYAREPSTDLWASTDVDVTATSAASIVVTPSVSTVAPNAVVQLTATVSTGATVTWSASGSLGSVNSSGTYTAPATPGVYVVQAAVGARSAVATIIVQ
ncbi:MAG: hypothetical protein Q8L14_33760 [Myxococcales bacterium]|nr:hypothetical protein [Myxococcales bacterium]